MDRRDKHGVSVREHLEQIRRQTGARPALLEDEPLIPIACRHVWEWFQALAAARGGNGFGPNPLSYTEIDAYTRLIGVRITGQEITWLRMLDSLYLQNWSETRTNGNGRHESEPGAPGEGDP